MRELDYEKKYKELRNSLWELQSLYLESWWKRWGGILTFCIFLLLLGIILSGSWWGYIVSLLLFSVSFIISLGVVVDIIGGQAIVKKISWVDASLRWRLEILKHSKDRKEIAIARLEKRPTEEKIREMLK